MPISDLCSKNLVSVEKSASLQYAAQLMKKHHVGGVIVSSDDIQQLIAKELNGLGRHVDRQLENEKIHRPQQSQLAL